MVACFRRAPCNADPRRCPLKPVPNKPGFFQMDGTEVEIEPAPPGTKPQPDPYKPSRSQPSKKVSEVVKRDVHHAENENNGAGLQRRQSERFRRLPVPFPRRPSIKKGFGNVPASNDPEFGVVGSEGAWISMGMRGSKVVTVKFNTGV